MRVIGVLVAASLTMPATAILFASPAISTGVRAVYQAQSPVGPKQAPASAAGSVRTLINVDAADTGRIFDGVGAISGGGGNSRLLIDYPAQLRNQILQCHCRDDKRKRAIDCDVQHSRQPVEQAGACVGDEPQFNV